MKLYSAHRESLIEDEANLLLPLLGSSPAWTASGNKGGFNGKGGIFRGDFDGRDLSEIQPVRAGSRHVNSLVRTDNSLSHAPIVYETSCFRKEGGRVF